MLMNEFWNRIEESMERMYDKGFAAGVNANQLSDHEAQNHRLEDMLHKGKEIGYKEGWTEGYKKGYEVGYSEGEMDTKAANGIIELDGIAEFDFNTEDDIEGALEE